MACPKTFIYLLFRRCVTTYEAGEDELLIHQFDDPELEKFNFYDMLKSFCIQADYWLKVHDVFPEGHVIIIDMKDYTLKVLPKVNIMFYKDFLLYLLVSLAEILFFTRKIYLYGRFTYFYSKVVLLGADSEGLHSTTVFFYKHDCQNCSRYSYKKYVYIFF